MRGRVVHRLTNLAHRHGRIRVRVKIPSGRRDYPLMGSLWTCRSLSAYRAVRHWTVPRLDQGKATASPRLCNLWQPLGSEDLSSDKRS